MLNTLLGVSFFAGLVLMSLTIIVAWDIIRSFMQGSNWRPLLFGAGILTVVFSFFITDITKIYTYPVWIYALVGFGYVLIASSLVIKKWDYLIFLTLVIPFIIPRDTFWFIAVTIPVFWIAHLAYRQYCLINCTSLHTFTVKQDRIVSNIWSTTISVYALLSANYFLAGLSFPSDVMSVILALNIVLKIGLICLMVYLIINFIRLTRREALVFPLILGFLLVTATSIFMLSYVINQFIQKEYLTDVSNDVKLYNYIAEQAYPDGLLSKKIESKSPELNDLADRIYLETGVRGTFFLGTERIAASTSATNGLRNLGSKITDTNVIDTVLSHEQPYVGTVHKNGQVVIAAYLPVTDGGKVIGMVGTGTTITDLDGLRTKVSDAIIFGGVLSMLIILGSVFFESRKSLKARKHHH